MAGTVLYEVDEHVATITYNRPDARNAINAELRQDQYRHLTCSHSDDRKNLQVSRAVTATSHSFLSLVTHVAQFRNTLYDRQADEEEHREREQPRRQLDARRCTADEYPQRIQAGQRQYVDERELFEHVTVGQAEGDIEADQPEHLRRERPADRRTRRDEGNGDDDGHAHAHVPRGERSPALLRMVAVRFQIVDIVDDVDPGRT